MKWVAVTGTPEHVARVLTRIEDREYGIRTPDGRPLITPPVMNALGFFVLFVAVRRNTPDSGLESILA